MGRKILSRLQNKKVIILIVAQVMAVLAIMLTPEELVVIDIVLGAIVAIADAIGLFTNPDE